MTAFFNSIVYWRRATMTAGYMAILCAALIAGASAGPDESSSDSVGIIDGEARIIMLPGQNGILAGLLAAWPTREPETPRPLLRK